MRSFLTSLALGVSTSFIWPGSGGGSAASAGVSQFGNLRLASATSSAVTGGYNNGYLLLNTTAGSIHHIGSAWTGMLGHGKMVDHAGGIGTVPYRARWLTQVGNFSLDSTIDNDSGSKTVTFGTPYSVAPPFIQLGLDGINSLTGYAVNISIITAGGFTSVYSAVASGESVTQVYWESNGTVAA